MHIRPSASGCERLRRAAIGMRPVPGKRLRSPRHARASIEGSVTRMTECRSANAPLRQDGESRRSSRRWNADMGRCQAESEWSPTGVRDIAPHRVPSGAPHGAGIEAQMDPHVGPASSPKWNLTGGRRRPQTGAEDEVTLADLNPLRLPNGVDLKMPFRASRALRRSAPRPFEGPGFPPPRGLPTSKSYDSKSQGIHGQWRRNHASHRCTFVCHS